MHFELVTFLPAEAQRICCVSTDLQRKYRKLGLLLSHDGRDARHTLFDVARMLALKAVGSQSLRVANDLAPWVTNAVVRRVLRYAEAYAPDARLAGADFSALADAVMAEHAPVQEIGALHPDRYFVVWADGFLGFYDVFDDALRDRMAAENPARVVGNITFFDAVAAAASLMASARRPFVVLEPEPVGFDEFRQPHHSRVMVA